MRQHGGDNDHANVNVPQTSVLSRFGRKVNATAVMAPTPTTTHNSTTRQEQRLRHRAEAAEEAVLKLTEKMSTVVEQLDTLEDRWDGKLNQTKLQYEKNIKKIEDQCKYNVAQVQKEAQIASRQCERDMKAQMEQVKSAAKQQQRDMSSQFKQAESAAKQQQRAAAVKLQQARTESQTASKKLKSMTNDVSGLHETVEDLERAHNAKVCELAEAHDDLEDAKQQQRAMTVKLQQAKTKSETSSKQIKSLSNDVSGLHDAVEFLERRHSAKVFEFAEVCESLKEAKQQCVDLRVEVTTMSEIIEEQEREALEFMSKFEEQKQRQCNFSSKKRMQALRLRETLLAAWEHDREGFVKQLELAEAARRKLEERQETILRQLDDWQEAYHSNVEITGDQDDEVTQFITKIGHRYHPRVRSMYWCMLGDGVPTAKIQRLLRNILKLAGVPIADDAPLPGKTAATNMLSEMHAYADAELAKEMLQKERGSGTFSMDSACKSFGGQSKDRLGITHTFCRGKAGTALITRPVRVLDMIGHDGVAHQEAFEYAYDLVAKSFVFREKVHGNESKVTGSRLTQQFCASQTDSAATQQVGNRLVFANIAAKQLGDATSDSVGVADEDNDAWLEICDRRPDDTNGDGDTDFDVDVGRRRHAHQRHAGAVFELLGGPAHHANCVNHGLCAICALAPTPDGSCEVESECNSAIGDVRLFIGDKQEGIPDLYCSFTAY